MLPGIDRNNLIRYLATIPTDQQPCETNLYISVRDRLRAVCVHRERDSFDPAKTLEVPDQEEIEALRLYGSAEHGSGALPNSIEYLLTQARLIYLAFSFWGPLRLVGGSVSRMFMTC